MEMPAGSTPPTSSRPTGTVTFLFSDIEGSTQRWERDRLAMAAALVRHDTLMRSAIEANRGYVFKTIGDAFCAAFPTVPDAIAAAHDAQRALSIEDFSAVDGFRVRMALHTGAADERDGDYFGPAVNRVARLLAIGHGSQVLVSGVTTDLLQGMSSKATLRDLGEHRLKDLARPERVYQLVAPDLPQTFPALRSLEALPNNLPLQLTSFVGREDEVAEIKTLLTRHRLVTLVGSGGAGKTRCAVQVGADLLDGSGAGVWLVELATISDGSLVASALAQGLGVQEAPNRSLLDTLLEYLKPRRLLLILDNCEHVIDAVRTVVAAIVRGCPDVHVLATSREALHIAGEQSYRMPSLAVPSMDGVASLESASRYGAIALFSDRASSADQRFTLTEESIPIVAEICRRLDGIPLAIELAAARVKVLSPRQLAQKLDERFRVLTGGDRSALPRQQTMRALIDWSYDLLSDTERLLFQRLSAFAGGFTLEGATAVCGDETIDELAILDVLSSLVDKSLLQAELLDGDTRYRLLESTRQYARERLIESGEYESVVRAHAVAYAELAERLDEEYQTTPDHPWLAQLEPELENFRTALEWAFGTHGDALLGQRLTCALRKAWWYLAAGEGSRWVRRALSLIDDTTSVPMLAELALTESLVAASLAQYKLSRAAAESAVALYRTLDDTANLAEAFRLLGRSMVLMGQVSEGRPIVEEALTIARTSRARKLISLSFYTSFETRIFSGDLSAARVAGAEALAIAKACGADRNVSGVTLLLAEIEFQADNPAAALQLALDTLRESPRRHTIQIAALQGNIAAYLIALEKFDDARVHAREALATFRVIQAESYVDVALQHLAAVAGLAPVDEAEREREYRMRSARILGYVNARLATLGATREYTEWHEYESVLSALTKAFGADDLAALMAEGRTWTEDQALAEAMRD